MTKIGAIIMIIGAFIMSMTGVMTGLDGWHDEYNTYGFKIAGFGVAMFSGSAFLAFIIYCAFLFFGDALKAWGVRYMPKRNPGFDANGYPTDPNVRYFWKHKK